MKQTLNAGESFIHSYRPEGVFRGDFTVTPMKFELTVFDKNGHSICLPEKLLVGGDTEMQRPELTLATGMLARHPIVTECGCKFTDHPVEGCPQGVFNLIDNRGKEWTYVLRGAWVGESGKSELKVLYGLAWGGGATFGIFDTRETSNGNHRIKGKAQPMYQPRNY